jgi:hypothetical protein
MTMVRILATVSTIALTTAAGVSGAGAYTALFDLTPAANLTGLTVSASVLANEQYNTAISVLPLNSGATIAIPVPPGAQDVNGGTILGLVSTNTIYAVGIGNLAADGYPGLSTEVKFGDVEPGNFIDLFTADGKANKAAATAASLQANDSGIIDVETDNASISSTFIDLGVGSSVSLDQNDIYSEAAGNLAVTTVSGDLNPGLVGGELGNSTVTNPAANELQSGATVLAASVQENLSMDIKATVTDARIGSLATVNLAPDPALTTLEGSTLEITDSNIRAQVTGNDGETTVIIDNDEALDLNGSAGVSNLQVSVGSLLLASVTDTVIEFGDSAGSTAVVDLQGSTLNIPGQRNSRRGYREPGRQWRAARQGRDHHRPDPRRLPGQHLFGRRAGRGQRGGGPVRAERAVQRCV